MRFLLRLLILVCFIYGFVWAYKKAELYALESLLPKVQASLDPSGTTFVAMGAESAGIRLFPIGFSFSKIEGTLRPYSGDMPEGIVKFSIDRMSLVYPWKSLLNGMRSMYETKQGQIETVLELDSVSFYGVDESYSVKSSFTRKESCLVKFFGSIGNAINDSYTCFKLPSFNIVGEGVRDPYVIVSKEGKREFRVFPDVSQYSFSGQEIAAVNNALPYEITPAEFAFIGKYPALSGMWYSLRKEAAFEGMSLFKETEKATAVSVYLFHYFLSKRYGSEMSAKLLGNDAPSSTHSSYPARYKQYALVGQIAQSKGMTKEQVLNKSFMDSFIFSPIQKVENKVPTN